MRRWLFGELDATLREILHAIERMETRLGDRMDGHNGELIQESRLTRASVENNTRVTREILVELREQRPILERIDDGVHANTEGLMHVLDELRGGRGGPGIAP
jgi:hypothetical protein